MTISQRMAILKVEPDAYKPMMALEKYIRSGGLGEDLLGLVRIRASQINGCAYCLDMHGREGREQGIAQRKMDVVAGWHEAPSLYTEREQAALALTEEMTRIGEHGVSEAVWNRVKAAFNDKEIVHLMMAVGSINVWNRLAITVHQDLPAA